MEKFDLDTPIAEFKGTIDETGKTASSFWTIRNAVEGVQIFGGIGSGKTSGSGRFLALKYLKNGFGGLVLTAKADEVNLWKNYAEITGRTRDLIIVDSEHQNYFNVLQYESKNSDGNQVLTANIVQVLKTVIKAGDQKESGSKDDPFWEGALDLLIFSSIELCLLAHGELDLQRLYDIVQTAPKKEEVERYWRLSSAVNNNSGHPDAKNAIQELETLNRKAFWDSYQKALDQIEKSITERLNSKSVENLEGVDNHSLGYQKSEDDERFDAVTQFFFETYSGLSEKTRSVIDFSFSAFVFRLLKEPVFSLFFKNRSTFSPDDCLDGRIIILNLPVKQFHKVGKDCQIMFKYIWQRAMERTVVEKDRRPVFLWADEAQNFIHEHDAEYQATARSSRIATVYLTQNLSNYYANMGGSHSEHRVKSFLGTLNTKFFHANADVDTNSYASNLMGKSYMIKEGISKSVSENFSSTVSKSLELIDNVRPEEFVSLCTGGPQNDFISEAYMHKPGIPFENGKNYQIRSFRQNYKPL